MIKRDFVGDTPEYGIIESSNHTCPNWVVSPVLGIVCKNETAVPDARQSRLDSKQCKAHTILWVTVVALIPVWLLLRRPRNVPPPHFVAIYGDSDEPAHQRELAFLTLREDARKKGSLIKDAQFVQLIFLALHLYLNDIWCQVHLHDRFNTILSPYMESEVALYFGFLFFGAHFLSEIWKLLCCPLWSWYRFYVRVIGKRWPSLGTPEALGLALREILFLSACPILGFLVTWPDEDALIALGGGKWSLRPFLFIFAISSILSSNQGTKYLDFAEDEVELFHSRYNPEIGCCSICGNLDQDFNGRQSDWISRFLNNGPEAGLSSLYLRKFWLCRQCEGSTDPSLTGKHPRMPSTRRRRTVERESGVVIRT